MVAHCNSSTWEVKAMGVRGKPGLRESQSKKKRIIKQTPKTSPALGVTSVKLEAGEAAWPRVPGHLATD